MSAIDLLAVAASSTDSDETEKEFEDSPVQDSPTITIDIPDHGKIYLSSEPPPSASFLTYCMYKCSRIQRA
jgi:hypothetical protein